jgi:uncharacterized damage-inducible protein DinB
MIYNHIIEKLAGNASTFKNLLENTSTEQARWRPTPGKWSLLEVTNHLYDEEREDFRQRLSNVLEDPRKPWSPIDPANWVIERGYNQREMDESLDNFLAERRNSVDWLKNLISPDWTATHFHPKLGEMSAEKLLANWLAHDYLHMRQIVFLQWSYLSHRVPTISLEYAGNLLT